MTSSRRIVDASPERDVDSSVVRTDTPERAVSKFNRPLRTDADEPLEVDHAELNTHEGRV